MFSQICLACSNR